MPAAWAASQSSRVVRCNNTSAAYGVSVVLFGQARQPGGQAFDGDLELRVQVDEFGQPGAQPGQIHVLLTASFDEFLNAAVGEIHSSTSAREGLLDHLLLLVVVHRVGADRGRGGGRA